MNNEFDWWLLIVGLVGGAGLVWLLISTGRDQPDLADPEIRRVEAEWIAARLGEAGTALDEATTERVLALHHDWETGGTEIDWDWDRDAPPVADEPARDDAAAEAHRNGHAPLASGLAPADHAGQEIQGDGGPEPSRVDPTAVGDRRE